MDNQETPSIIEAIETTAADMRRAYLASLQPEWPPGRLAGPLGELEIRFCIPPSPAEPPAGGCDWGYCDNPAALWRWSEDHGGWLPVCTGCETKPEHGRPRQSADPPGYRCSCGMWMAGQIDPTGERCSCGELLNNGVCPNYPQPPTTINTNER